VVRLTPCPSSSARPPLAHPFLPGPSRPIYALISPCKQAGTYVKDEVARAMLVLLTNTPDLQAYSTRSFYRALSANVDSAAPTLLHTAVWAVGEYGEMLLPSMGGPLLEGEASLSVSDSDVSPHPHPHPGGASAAAAGRAPPRSLHCLYPQPTYWARLYYGLALIRPSLLHGGGPGAALCEVQ
jgi:hypothetical protein